MSLEWPADFLIMDESSGRYLDFVKGHLKLDGTSFQFDVAGKTPLSLNDDRIKDAGKTRKGSTRALACGFQRPR